MFDGAKGEDEDEDIDEGEDARKHWKHFFLLSLSLSLFSPAAIMTPSLYLMASTDVPVTYGYLVCCLELKREESG